MPASSIMAAVHRMDLKALPAESVDILQKIAPTQEYVSGLFTFLNLFIFNIFRKIKIIFSADFLMFGIYPKITVKW